MSTQLLTIGAINSMKPSQLRDVVSNKEQQGPVRLHAFGRMLEGMGEQFWSTLPKHVTRERMQGLALKTIRKEPKILDCSIESVLSAISDAASLGLDIDGQLGHAYLIPYKSEAKLVLGYRGLLDLARRFDKIDISTHCVFEGDQFYFQFGDSPQIQHVPQQDDVYQNDDKITHVYLVARDESGRIICRSVWSRARIEAHKEKFSPGWRKSDSPWNKSWSTMARKTLIRDSINRGEIPVSSEIQSLTVQEEHMEASEAGVFQQQAPRTIADLNAKPAPKGESPKIERQVSIESTIDPGDQEEAEGWVSRVYDGFLCGEYSKEQCVEAMRTQAEAGFVDKSQIERFEKLKS